MPHDFVSMPPVGNSACSKSSDLYSLRIQGRIAGTRGGEHCKPQESHQVVLIRPPSTM